jgi:hypothetical protein
LDVTDSELLASNQAHCQVRWVYLHPYAFFQSFDNQFPHFGIESRPALLKAKHKPRKEEQKGLRDRVVRGTMNVGSSFQDLPDKIYGFRELMASSVLEEETQYVAAYHRVYSILEVGEESLMASGSLVSLELEGQSRSTHLHDTVW